MTFKSNLKRLNKLLELAPRKNREKIKEVIQLYEDKKIPNIKTAHLAVLQLANPSIFKKADETYQDLKNKYREAEPMTGRLSRPPKRKIKATTQVRLIMYKRKSVVEQALNEGIGGYTGPKKYLSKQNPDYKQVWIGHGDIPGDHSAYFTSLIGKFISKEKEKKRIYENGKII